MQLTSARFRRMRFCPLFNSSLTSLLSEMHSSPRTIRPRMSTIVTEPICRLLVLIFMGGSPPATIQFGTAAALVKQLTHPPRTSPAKRTETATTRQDCPSAQLHSGNFENAFMLLVWLVTTLSPATPVLAESIAMTSGNASV